MWYLVLCCLFDLLNARPLGLTDSPVTSGAELWVLISVAVFTSTVFLLLGCLCCNRRKASSPQFREFRNSTHSLNQIGFVNPLSCSPELSIFPPPGGPHSIISFEPLPTLVPPQHSLVKRPPAYSEALVQQLSMQSWFDDSGFQFPRQQLHYVKEIGRGWFGKVVEGEARGLEDAQRRTKVFVRILKEEAAQAEKLFFLHEARPYRQLRHSNILRLLGACIETDPYLLLFESCARGDLKEFLLSNEISRNVLLEQGIAIRMAVDVATGLSHMIDNDFIHTDVAARNCLVTSELRVKIGDTGSSIDKYPRDYYVNGEVALPIRWCAPQSLVCSDTSIQTCPVTEKCNVWSFGVLLWEIFEFGKLPYSELSDDQVITRVFGPEALRLAAPAAASTQVFNMMEQCWRQGVTMSDVLTRLTYVLSGEQQGPEDFNRKWGMYKPNRTLSDDRDSGLGSEQRKSMESFLNLDQVSKSCPSVAKSPSLENFTGSLENLTDHSWLAISSVSQLREGNASSAQPSLPPVDFQLGPVSSSTSMLKSSPSYADNEADSLSLPYHLRSTNNSLLDTDTEDEMWRKRLERCEFSEKVKEKSKSVADLMVLTHIDASSGSSESSLELHAASKPKKYLVRRASSDSNILDRVQCEDTGKRFSMVQEDFVSLPYRSREPPVPGNHFLDHSASEQTNNQPFDVAIKSSPSETSDSVPKIIISESEPAQVSDEELCDPVPPPPLYYKSNVRIVNFASSSENDEDSDDSTKHSQFILKPSRCEAEESASSVIIGCCDEFSLDFTTPLKTVSEEDKMFSQLDLEPKLTLEDDRSSRTTDDEKSYKTDDDSRSYKTEEDRNPSDYKSIVTPDEDHSCDSGFRDKGSLSDNDLSDNNDEITLDPQHKLLESEEYNLNDIEDGLFQDLLSSASVKTGWYLHEPPSDDDASIINKDTLYVEDYEASSSDEEEWWRDDRKFLLNSDVAEALRKELSDKLPSSSNTSVTHSEEVEEEDETLETRTLYVQYPKSLSPILEESETEYESVEDEDQSSLVLNLVPFNKRASDSDTEEEEDILIVDTQSNEATLLSPRAPLEVDCSESERSLSPDSLSSSPSHSHYTVSLSVSEPASLPSYDEKSQDVPTLPNFEIYDLSHNSLTLQDESSTDQLDTPKLSAASQLKSQSCSSETLYNVNFDETLSPQHQNKTSSQLTLTDQLDTPKLSAASELKSQSCSSETLYNVNFDEILSPQHQNKTSSQLTLTDQLDTPKHFTAPELKSQSCSSETDNVIFEEILSPLNKNNELDENIISNNLRDFTIESDSPSCIRIFTNLNDPFDDSSEQNQGLETPLDDILRRNVLCYDKDISSPLSQKCLIGNEELFTNVFDEPINSNKEMCHANATSNATCNSFQENQSVESTDLVENLIKACDSKSCSEAYANRMQETQNPFIRGDVRVPSHNPFLHSQGLNPFHSPDETCNTMNYSTNPFLIDTMNQSIIKENLRCFDKEDKTANIRQHQMKNAVQNIDDLLSLPVLPVSNEDAEIESKTGQWSPVSSLNHNSPFDKEDQMKNAVQNIDELLTQNGSKVEETENKELKTFSEEFLKPLALGDTLISVENGTKEEVTQESPSKGLRHSVNSKSWPTLQHLDSEELSPASRSCSVDAVVSSRFRNFIVTKVDDAESTSPSSSSDNGSTEFIWTNPLSPSEDVEQHSDSDEEFVPSSWNSDAVPAKSLLKINKPDSNEPKKNVSFKKQHYHCVYEYPRDPSECKASRPTPSSLSFDCVQFSSPMSTEDGEFFISSSLRPFHNTSSEFFVGDYPNSFFFQPDASGPEAGEESVTSFRSTDDVEASPPSTSTLGELCHTKQKLKLDLVSPLTQTSPLPLPSHKTEFNFLKSTMDLDFLKANADKFESASGESTRKQNHKLFDEEEDDDDITFFQSTSYSVDLSDPQSSKITPCDVEFRTPQSNEYTFCGVELTKPQGNKSIPSCVELITPQTNESTSCDVELTKPQSSDIPSGVKLITPKSNESTPSVVDLLKPQSKESTPSGVDLTTPQSNDSTPSVVDLLKPQSKESTPSVVDLLKPQSNDSTLSGVELITPQRDESNLSAVELITPQRDESNLSAVELITPQRDESNLSAVELITPQRDESNLSAVELITPQRDESNLSDVQLITPQRDESNLSGVELITPQSSKKPRIPSCLDIFTLPSAESKPVDEVRNGFHPPLEDTMNSREKREEAKKSLDIFCNNSSNLVINSLDSDESSGNLSMYTSPNLIQNDLDVSSSSLVDSKENSCFDEKLSQSKITDDKIEEIATNTNTNIKKNNVCNGEFNTSPLISDFYLPNDSIHVHSNKKDSINDEGSSNKFNDLTDSLELRRHCV